MLACEAGATCWPVNGHFCYLSIYLLFHSFEHVFVQACIVQLLLHVLI